MSLIQFFFSSLFNCIFFIHLYREILSYITWYAETNLMRPIVALLNTNFLLSTINSILKFLKSYSMAPNLASIWILKTISHPSKGMCLESSYLKFFSLHVPCQLLVNCITSDFSFIHHCYLPRVGSLYWASFSFNHCEIKKVMGASWINRCGNGLLLNVSRDPYGLMRC